MKSLFITTISWQLPYTITIWRINVTSTSMTILLTISSVVRSSIMTSFYKVNVTICVPLNIDHPIVKKKHKMEWNREILRCVVIIAHLKNELMTPCHVSQSSFRRKTIPSRTCFMRWVTETLISVMEINRIFTESWTHKLWNYGNFNFIPFVEECRSWVVYGKEEQAPFIDIHLTQFITGHIFGLDWENKIQNVTSFVLDFFVMFP